MAKEIDEWCRAAQVRRRFRYTNIAQIGRPYPGMMDLYIDETNLYNRMGLYTKQFDWEKMWQSRILSQMRRNPRQGRGDSGYF